MYITYIAHVVDMYWLLYFYTCIGSIYFPGTIDRTNVCGNDDGDFERGLATRNANNEPAPVIRCAIAAARSLLLQPSAVACARPLFLRLPPCCCPALLRSRFSTLPHADRPSLPSYPAIHPHPHHTRRPLITGAYSVPLVDLQDPNNVQLGAVHVFMEKSRYLYITVALEGTNLFQPYFQWNAAASRRPDNTAWHIAMGVSDT